MRDAVKRMTLSMTLLALAALLVVGCKPGELTLTGLVNGPPGADLSGWIPAVMNREGLQLLVFTPDVDAAACQEYLRYGTLDGGRYRVSFPAEWTDASLFFYADTDGDGMFSPSGSDPEIQAYNYRTDIRLLAEVENAASFDLWPLQRLEVELGLPPGMDGALFKKMGLVAISALDRPGLMSIVLKPDGASLTGSTAYAYLPTEEDGPYWGCVNAWLQDGEDGLEYWFTSDRRPESIRGVLAPLGSGLPMLSFRARGLEPGAWIMAVGKGLIVDTHLYDRARVGEDGVARMKGIYGPASYWLYVDRTGDGFSEDDRAGYYDGGSLVLSNPGFATTVIRDATLALDLSAPAWVDCGELVSLTGYLALPAESHDVPWDDPRWSFSYAFNLEDSAPRIFPEMNGLFLPLPGRLEGVRERWFEASMPAGSYGVSLRARLETPGVAEDEWPSVYWFLPDGFEPGDQGTLEPES